MNTELIMKILQIALYLILGGIALWFRTNAKIKGKVSSVIEEAESVYSDTVKAGGAKHQYVVDTLYNLVPVGLRFIITKDVISGIVDRTFESIQSYAKLQLDKLVDKVVKE